MKIQRLFIYPIKSLLPVEVPFAEITSEGFRFDRQYVLVKAPSDESVRFAEHLTVKKLFQLALFQPTIDDGWSKLTVRHTQAQPASSVTIPLTPSPLYCSQSRSYVVSIFGTSAVGIDMGDDAATFFSKHLGFSVRLLFIGGDGQRAIPRFGTTSSTPTTTSVPSTLPQRNLQPQRIRFADVAPFLITSSASEGAARSRLPYSSQSEDIIVRFRPNIHIEVDDDIPAFDEDEWKQLVVQSITDDTVKATIYCIFKTARCLSLNIDLKTGKSADRDQQLYGLLARDRRVNNVFPHKPVFGQYAYVAPVGITLQVGDQVRITQRSKSLGQ